MHLLHVDSVIFHLSCIRHRAYIALQHELHGVIRRQDGVRRPAIRRKTVFVTTILANLRSWLRYRETVRELSRLTNRELSDLGIQRGEIEDPLLQAL
ncbi:MAG: DUF1127 domain-containing protein [Akkermansiaceae bacterium]|nr:DUF1127 domain-containing protein [Akkermansiaceae bacterium]